MTTIAEDLLNDFESDDDDNQDEQNGELFADHGYSDEGLVDPGKLTGALNGDHMELEGDEEQHDDEDPDAAAPSHLKMDDAEDEEEAKARIEKMQLASVSDVRSVAGLMRQLEPVMEVSKSTSYYTRRRTTVVYNV
jgi:U4/U6 small nuclear ribonucleoprotein PRP31